MISPSREVWCEEMLATCAELYGSTDAYTQRQGLLSLATLCVRPPADLSPLELTTVLRPLAIQVREFVARVAAEAEVFGQVEQSRRGTAAASSVGSGFR